MQNLAFRSLETAKTATADLSRYCRTEVDRTRPVTVVKDQKFPGFAAVCWIRLLFEVVSRIQYIYLIIPDLFYPVFT